MPQVRKLGALFLTVVFAVTLLGASGDPARFDRVGHRLMCVCGCNQILVECNHIGCPYSDRMRNQLIAALDRDNSDDGVLQSFVQEFGTTVLAAPTARGFDRVAWIMPFAVFFAGALLAVAVIRNWRGRQPVAVGHEAGSPGLDRYLDQARQETEL